MARTLLSHQTFPETLSNINLADNTTMNGFGTTSLQDFSMNEPDVDPLDKSIDTPIFSNGDEDSLIKAPRRLQSWNNLPSNGNNYDLDYMIHSGNKRITFNQDLGALLYTVAFMDGQNNNNLSKDYSKTDPTFSGAMGPPISY